jgi:hypothetical protein
MKRLFRLVFLTLALLVPSIVFADEAEDRMRIGMQALNRFTLGQYADLERSIDEARRKETRTPSGLWTLTMIDAGIKGVFRTDPRDEAAWEKHRGHAQAWVDAYPKSAAPRLAYAQMLFEHGWRYRGGAFARDVRPENWAPFRKYVRSAGAYLASSKAIASTDPRWYEYMAKIAADEQWPQDRFDAMIDEGLTRYPTYYPAVFRGDGVQRTEVGRQRAGDRRLRARGGRAHAENRRRGHVRAHLLVRRTITVPRPVVLAVEGRLADDEARHP